MLKFSLVSVQILALTALCLTSPASAYTMEPSLVQMSASGASSVFFRLENKEAKVSAVEITIHEHHKNLQGESIAGKDAEDDFIIYPAQLIMLPGDEVGVQILWIGDPALTAERAFTVVAREVPIPIEKSVDESEKSEGVNIQVTVLRNYKARLYVTPKDAKPRVVVESLVEHLPTRDVASAYTLEPSTLEIVLANLGAAHKSTTTMTLVLIPLDETGTPLDARAVTLAATKIPGLRAHLLAGERRKLVIPRPTDVPAGPIKIILSE